MPVLARRTPLGGARTLGLGHRLEELRVLGREAGVGRLRRLLSLGDALLLRGDPPADGIELTAEARLGVASKVRVRVGVRGSGQAWGEG